MQGRAGMRKEWRGNIFALSPRLVWISQAQPVDLHWTAQHCTSNHCTAQHKTALQSTAQNRTAQNSKAQDCTAKLKVACQESTEPWSLAENHILARLGWCHGSGRQWQGERNISGQKAAAEYWCQIFPCKEGKYDMLQGAFWTCCEGGGMAPGNYRQSRAGWGWTGWQHLHNIIGRYTKSTN